MPMKIENSHLSPEERQQRKAKYRNLLILLAIMITVTVVSFLRSENAVGFQWTETQMQFTDPGGSSHTILYKDILSLELAEDPDYGSCISGRKTSAWRYGTWENQDWGRYTLCANTSTGICIVLQTQDGTFVLSYESDDITTALYDYFLSCIGTS